MYWVCDVIIDEEHRGRKLGALLIESIVNAEELKGIGKGILTTRDAQGLYEKFGFRSIESGMIRKLSDLEAEQLKEDRW
jgi:ribosomal protein S18 acetylase RimI-like enzyme